MKWSLLYYHLLSLMEEYILVNFLSQNMTNTCLQSISPLFLSSLYHIQQEWKKQRSLFPCFRILTSVHLWVQLKINELNSKINTWVRCEFSFEGNWLFVDVCHFETDSWCHKQVWFNIDDIIRLGFCSFNAHSISPSCSFLSDYNEVETGFSWFHRFEQKLKFKRIVGMIKTFLWRVNDKEFINKMSKIIRYIFQFIRITIILLIILNSIQRNLYIFRCGCSTLSGQSGYNFTFVNLCDSFNRECPVYLLTDHNQYFAFIHFTWWWDKRKWNL